jgi:hypothetical protein
VTIAHWESLRQMGGYLTTPWESILGSCGMIASLCRFYQVLALNDAEFDRAQVNSCSSFPNGFDAGESCIGGETLRQSGQS